MTAQYRPKGSSVLWCPGQQFPDVPCQLVMGTHGILCLPGNSVRGLISNSDVSAMHVTHGEGAGLWEMKALL